MTQSRNKNDNDNKREKTTEDICDLLLSLKIENVTPKPPVSL